MNVSISWFPSVDISLHTKRVPYDYWHDDLCCVKEAAFYIEKHGRHSIVYIPSEQLMCVYVDSIFSPIHTVLHISPNESRKHVTIDAITSTSNIEIPNEARADLFLFTFLVDVVSLNSLVEYFFGNEWSCSCADIHDIIDLKEYLHQEVAIKKGARSLPSVTTDQHAIASYWFDCMTQIDADAATLTL